MVTGFHARDVDVIAIPIDRGENHCTLRNLGRFGPVTRCVRTVTRMCISPPIGVHQAGVQHDSFADGDGTVEVEVADRPHHALARTPQLGGGFGELLQPSEQCSAVDDAETADVVATHDEPVNHLVMLRSSHPAAQPRVKATVPQAGGPYGIAYDARDRLWVASSGTNEVVGYDMILGAATRAPATADRAEPVHPRRRRDDRPAVRRRGVRRRGADRRPARERGRRV